MCEAIQFLNLDGYDRMTVWMTMVGSIPSTTDHEDGDRVENVIARLALHCMHTNPEFPMIQLGRIISDVYGNIHSNTHCTRPRARRWASRR